MDLGLILVVERERVLEVLMRDKHLRTLDEERIRRMKNELQQLRRQGAKSYCRQYGERTCARCQRPLGQLWNSGAVCRGCSHRICSRCRVCRTNVGWKCTVCHAYRDVKVRSGEWFLEERAKKFPRTTDKYQTVGGNLLKTLEVMSHISVVPPTPPLRPMTYEYAFLSKDLKETKPFTKSMEDLMSSVTGQIRKLSRSNADIREDLLSVDCTDRRSQFINGSQKSRSDTDINKPYHLLKWPSLPNIFKKRDSDAEGSSTGTGDDMSLGSDCSEGKRGSGRSINADLSLPGPPAVSGDLQMALSYNQITSCLEVTVGGCRDLTPGDPKKGRCHPFVKIFFLPEKSHKLKTSVKKNTTDPVFNEVFQVHIERHLLVGKTLQATVWHSVGLMRKVFLGEVLLRLDGRVFDDNTSQNLKWYQLCPKQTNCPDGGAVDQDVAFKFRYSSQDELLQLSSLKHSHEKDEHHKI